MPGSPNVDGNDLLKFHMVKKAEIKPNTELSKIVDAEIKEYFEKFDNNPQNGTLDQIELLEYIKERAKIPSADPGQGKREEITSETGEKLVKFTKGAVTQYYDIKGRLLKETTNLGSGGIKEVKYEYTEDGNVNKITFMNGKQVSATDSSAAPEQPAAPASTETTEAPEQPAAPTNTETTEEAEQPAAPATPEATEDPAAQNKPENRYKGENKPAATANWNELNGKYFEAIDEPDENGNLPTRPIHGKITVEGEVAEGQNPKKFTITDQDNGQVYTFELCETEDGKVIYKCTSGGGKSYTEGNAYELRTINGVPMLVQMEGTEGHGVALGKSAPKASEAPKTGEAPKTEESPETGEAPKTEEAPETGEAPKAGETPTMTAEERAAKVAEATKALEPNLKAKKSVDKDLEAEVTVIAKAIKEAPQISKDIKAELEAWWTSNSKAEELLSKITPENVAYVVSKYQDIVDKIDNVVGFDNEEVYEYIVKDLQARLSALGIEEPKLVTGQSISKDTSIKEMDLWVIQATNLILEDDSKKIEAYKAEADAVKAEKAELSQIGDKEKEVITNANKTLAEAAYAEPKLEVKKDKDGDDFVELPDGRRIVVERDDNGKITAVHIDKDTNAQDYDIRYTADRMSIDTDNSNDSWEASLSSDNYDFNKVIEFARLIFGEGNAE